MKKVVSHFVSVSGLAADCSFDPRARDCLFSKSLKRVWDSFTAEPAFCIVSVSLRISSFLESSSFPNSSKALASSVLGLRFDSSFFACSLKIARSSGENLARFSWIEDSPVAAWAEFTILPKKESKTERYALGLSFLPKRTIGESDSVAKDAKRLLFLQSSVSSLWLVFFPGSGSSTVKGFPADLSLLS